MPPRHREATCLYELNSKNHPHWEAKHTLRKARCTQWFFMGLREDSMWLHTETDQEPWSLATPPWPPDFFTQHYFQSYASPTATGRSARLWELWSQEIWQTDQTEERDSLCILPAIKQTLFLIILLKCHRKTNPERMGKRAQYTLFIVCFRSKSC